MSILGLRVPLNHSPGFGVSTWVDLIRPELARESRRYTLISLFDEEG